MKGLYTVDAFFGLLTGCEYFHAECENHVANNLPFSLSDQHQFFQNFGTANKRIIQSR